jgi:hypothetical protein
VYIWGIGKGISTELYFAGLAGEVSSIIAHILRLCVIVVVVVVAR